MTRYMISYTESNPPRLENGNIELTLPRPIRDMDDVSVVQRMVRDQFGLTNPIIMGFSPFDDGADQ